MTIGFRITEAPFEVEELQPFSELISLVFGEQFPEPDFAARVNEKHGTMIIAASSGERLVGFKLGFEKHRNVFQSWIGCVHPEFRRHGIARSLLRRQHEWCAEKGYKTVVTNSRNKFKNMMILNLSEGFSVVGTEWGISDSSLSVMFAKSLEANGAK